MKITNIYIASNGDIFARHDGAFKEHSPVEVAKLLAEASRLLSEGKTTFCIAKVSENPVSHLNYYEIDGSFISTAEMHISQSFSSSQDFFYLRRLSSDGELKSSFDKVATSVGAAIPLTQWAIEHGIDPSTARQRALRGAFKTARKLGRNWIIDKDEELYDHRKKS